MDGVSSTSTCLFRRSDVDLFEFISRACAHKVLRPVQRSSLQFLLHRKIYIASFGNCSLVVKLRLYMD